MRINNNLQAMNTHRQLGMANAGGAKSMEKLSSGFRINRAGDDAAGLSISEKMRGQIRGLNMASKNSQDAISLIQTAEGALTETHAILQRMRELAVQAGNDTNVGDDRTEIQNEINQLIEELDRIGNQTEFNTQKLLDGGAAQAASGAGGEDAELAAELVGSTAVTVTDFATDNLSFDVNGTTVTLDSDLTDEQGVADAINTALNGTGITVELNADNKLVFKGAEDIVISNAVEANGSTLAAIGLAEGTTEAVAPEGAQGDGFTATFQVGANKGQTFDISIGDMRAAALGLTAKDGTDAELAAELVGSTAVTVTDFATDNLSFDVNGTTVTLDSDLTDEQGVADAINTALNGTGITVELNADNKLVFKGAEDIVISNAVEANGSTLAAIGLAEGTTEAVAPEGAATGIDVSDNTKANNAIKTIDDAIKQVSAQRSKLGAWQNRLEHTIKNLDTSSENLQAAEARIRDVDMAKEMMEQTKNNILQQASTAMLAQANQAPQGVLQLLR